VSIGSPSERKSAPFVSSVSIGAGSVLAEDFSATELLKIQDLPPRWTDPGSSEVRLSCPGSWCGHV
jgi:hypothetical protein